MKHIAFLLLTLTFASYGYCQKYHPTAAPAAIVISGPARFTVLTDGLIRMEYSPDSTFTDQASLTIVNRLLPVPAYKIEHKDGKLQIETSLLRLSYLERSGPFSARNLSISYNDSTRRFSWQPGLKDKQNLKGTTRTLDGVSGKFSLMGMKKLRLDDGILSRSGWAVIDDSERPLFDSSEWPWVEDRKKIEQDLYFFGYGDHYKKALFDFIQVAGRISLPPQYAFGVWYSRYWAYTEADMKDIVEGYAKSDLPLDVMVIDMDWHLTEKSSPEVFKQYDPKLNGWTGFTWEKKYFPDHKEFLSWLHEHHIQSCLNLHPAAGVQAQEKAYGAFANAMHADTSGHKAIPFDITNKIFAQNYFNILLHPYERDGVDFWWLDWQQWGSTNIKGVNPTFYLNYVHYSDMQRQGKRPLIFHRYGGLGNHRYQIGFSGDYMIGWKGLAYQPEFTATASNVGFGYWSHDIGGHWGLNKKNKQDAELYTRWVQWGAFSPIFRTHATNDKEIERRMWLYPAENLNAMREALKMRYSLIPYIYTCARQAYDSGVSVIRPMYYENPSEERYYHLPHQYYFGANMIVAPIYERMKGKHQTHQKIWLPEGVWHDFKTGAKIAGNQMVDRAYGLGDIPVYVRSGSIITEQPSRQHISGYELDTLILAVYADSQASAELYEDDGISENYRLEGYSITKLRYQRTDGRAIVTVTPTDTDYNRTSRSRCYMIRLLDYDKPDGISSEWSKVTDGYEWRYDASKRMIEISVPRDLIRSLVVPISGLH